MAWVYLLRCGDGTFYVGSTTSLDDRVQQHSSGIGDGYTAKRQPIELVWKQEFDTIDEAWVVERRLHGWGRAKRQALVDGEYEILPQLSRNVGSEGRTERGRPVLSTGVLA